MDQPLIYPDLSTWNAGTNTAQSTCIISLSESGSWFMVYQEADDEPLYGQVTTLPACTTAINSNPAFQTGGW